MSPKYSMQGWSWHEWLKRNKDSLKTLVAGLGAVLGALAATVVLPAWAIPLPALLSGFVTKMALDALDYWCSEQEAPNGVSK